jgi:hypothetical protein
LIWNVQRVLGIRLTAIQTELGEVNLAALELFKVALDPRSADVKAEPAKSSGGEIPKEHPHIASGLEAELDEVDALCAKLITLVPRRIRIDRNGAIVVRNGAVAVALAVIGAATVVEGIRVIRINPDGLVEVGNGTVAVTLGVVRVAAAVEGIRVVRIDPDGLVEVGNGAVAVALGVVRVAAIVEGIRVIRDDPMASSKSAMARSRSPLTK